MRKYFILLLLTLCTGVASAQIPGHFGARLALDVTNPAGKHNNLETGAGFHVGAVYQLPLAGKFYVEPGVMFYFTAMSTDKPVELDGSAFDATVKNYGFSIPVNMGYNFNLLPNLTLSAFTGPQFNFNISAKQSYSPNFNVPDPHSTNLFDYGWKHFDMQWGFGVGLTFSKSYYVGVSGDVAVTPMSKFGSHKSYVNVYRNSFAITLGYNF